MDAITVANLGKAYKQYSSQWARMQEWLIPGRFKRHKLKWVLQNVSFSVVPGEALGVIGLNGAGKSTLLKIITGTTQPTTGTVQMTGRVAALLELGMGFHPEFTGRENVFIAGQLFGMSVAEITNLMPEIEDFAEIGDYIDQPLKIYSSGMQIRLAFSMATAIRPDILIVDEALSVGDAYFQHKSFERIRSYRRAGTTILMVSHDKQAIQAICDRALLLNSGKIVMAGEPEAVMDYYNALLAPQGGAEVSQTRINGRVETISGSREASIEHVALLNDRGESVNTITVGSKVALSVGVRANQNLPRLVFGYMLKDRLGQPVYGTNTHHLGQALEQLSAGQRFEFRLYFDANLGVGSYSISVALHGESTHLDGNYEWRDMALLFNVINPSKSEFIGVAWLPPRLEVKQ